MGGGQQFGGRFPSRQMEVCVLNFIRAACPVTTGPRVAAFELRASSSLLNRALPATPAEAHALITVEHRIAHKSHPLVEPRLHAGPSAPHTESRPKLASGTGASAFGSCG